MSFSSAERSPANRRACHALIVFVALLLAGLSGAMPKFADFPPEKRVEQSAPKSVFDQVGSPGEEAGQRPIQRGLFVTAAYGGETRNYHPTVRTSDSAGALGFWILISLCVALLMGGFAPWVVQWVRRRGS